MIRFENPEMLCLFLLIPLLVLLFLVYRMIRRRAFRKFGSKESLAQMLPLVSDTRVWLKFIMVIIAVASLTFAAMNPQTGSRMEEGRLEGFDIVVALDASRSMLAQDISPDRMERARLAVNRLINQLEQDRIGIVVFAGTAHTQVPLTSDLNAAKMILSTVNTNTVSVQGTAIEAAIDRALMSFNDESSNNKTIIIVSDGESHEDSPQAAAKRAADQDVIIHVVGIGSREGAPIPIIENNQTTGFFRDNEGNTVITRYDEPTLRELAEITGGIFRHGTGASMGLDEILKEIRSLDKEAYDTIEFSDYESRYHYFVAIALLLLIAEMLIMSRKNKYLGKINIFG
jgi:Ca-activated chloride channel homolog